MFNSLAISIWNRVTALVVSLVALLLSWLVYGSIPVERLEGIAIEIAFLPFISAATFVYLIRQVNTLSASKELSSRELQRFEKTATKKTHIYLYMMLLNMSIGFLSIVAYLFFPGASLLPMALTASLFLFAFSTGGVWIEISYLSRIERDIKSREEKRRRKTKLYKELSNSHSSRDAA